MATPDVPGSNPRNGDTLHDRCWAEHSDGSYVKVDGIENGRVVFEVFDTSKNPIVEYRDAMPEDQFKRQFSWDAKDPASIRWTWHDRTNFPWEVLFQKGLQSGSRIAFGRDVIRAAADIVDTMDRVSGTTGNTDDDGGAGAAARRVARDLGLRGRALQTDEVGRVRRALTRLRDGIQDAIDELRA
jgi:hypothetical protein